MRYVEARLSEYDREAAYRIYITKSLQLAPQSKYLVETYEDWLNPKKEDTRSGDEIALEVIQKAGLSFGGTK